jgi:exonuclease III
MIHMRNYILIPLVCLSCFVFSGIAHGQLRIVTYNTNTFNTEVGNSNIRPVRAGAEIVIEAIGEEVVNGIARPADIILLQEQQQPDTTTQDLLDRVNAIYQSQGIIYARGFEVGRTTSTSGLGTPDPREIRQGVIYRTDTVELIFEDSFGNLSGGLISQPRETLLHQFRPVGFGANSDLYIFNSHFEAGDGDEDMAGRETEADQIRGYIDSNNLGGSNVIVAGDLNVSDNFDSSSATIFGNLSALEILAAGGDGRVLDPLFPNGEVVNFSILDSGVPNAPFGVDLGPFLTQSPSSGSGFLVGGGIDDRFDFILQSDELLDGNGVSSIPNSLRSFGNNGSTLNTPINVGNTITINGLTSFSTSQVLDALESTSDHLPVVEDFQLPAKLAAELLTNVPAEVVVGDTVTLELLVSNGTNVANASCADELDFMVFTFGGVLGSFSGTDLALGDGVSVTLALDTAQLGPQEGVINVVSNGQGNVLNGMVEIEVSFEVVDVVSAPSAALPSVFSAQVEEDEIDASEDGVNSAFFTVQGDDDRFTVYSLVDFDTSLLGEVSAIDSLSIELTQSNIFFSASGGLEFFLATDTRAVDLNDSARFISDQANGGANTGEAVVGNSFGTLFPLGTGMYNETATGDVDTIVLTLDAAGEAFAVSQINSGGLLRIIATPADVSVQATYSGAGSILTPPSPPVLNVIAALEDALLGDVNLDGVVNFLDIAPFIGLLTNTGFQAEADTNQDGTVSFLDIAPFIAILSGV